MPEPENARDRVTLQRIRNGDTYEAIGHDCGITRQRVQQIAEKYDVRPLSVAEKPLSGTDLLVEQLLRSEPRLSYGEVSEHTGVSVRQVRRVAEKAELAWIRWPVYRRGIHRWDYDEAPDTGCWNWRHGKSAQGHGRLNVGQGRSEYAHRFAYEQHHGRFPFGAAVVHTCGNHSCVNPEHLSMAPRVMEDAVARQEIDSVVVTRLTGDASREWVDPRALELHPPPEIWEADEGIRPLLDEPTYATDQHAEGQGLAQSYNNPGSDVIPPAETTGKSTPRRRVTVALVYDFDGTLAPGNMQERQFIPDVGMTPHQFWTEVDHLASANQADRILMYMYFMLRKAGERGVPVRAGDFRERGRGLEFFDGVLEWFGRINDYGKSRGVRIEHYIVSSGNAEIIEGTPVADLVDRIYASRFLFDQNGVAVWPALAVNYTTKTQFLFRINKGAHDLSDDSGINRFVAKEDRPVPFENMVYIGDGETDVPCFRLVKDLGGLSVAVFPPRTRNARQKAQRFVDEGRVHCVAPADYTEDSRLDWLVKANIELLANREALGQAMVRS